jgi:predicted TIM-barrel fold metal-dependent hydrolase
LQVAVQVFGPDRIMLGTDYPILAPEAPTDTVARAKIDGAERALVLDGNARSLISRFS